MTIRFVPDAQWFRSQKGNGVLAGSPLTYFGVTDAGSKILDAIESNADLPQNHSQLTDRLLATGAVHPAQSMEANSSDVTVVIPAFITDTQSHTNLENLIASLIGLAIVVVDDASPHPVHISGARVIRHDTNKGPAAARNTGIALVATKFVACIDADVSVTSEQLLTLAGYLADERVAMVAPRITCLNDKTFIGEFESLHSPLDLGSTPALVRPMSRVSYLPATVLVCNTNSLRTVGSFDESLRLGEDVDLVWRCTESGLWCRYVPAIECPHRARRSIRALFRQRFEYGSSAAALDQRHPHRASPLRAHALLLVAAMSILMGLLSVAVVFIALTILYFCWSLRSTKISMTSRTRLAWLGITSTTKLLAQAIMRCWWPLFLLASLVSWRPGVMLTFSALVPSIFGLMRFKPNHPIRYLLVRIISDMSYASGVWAGAIRVRSVRCLLPVITARRSISR